MSNNIIINNDLKINKNLILPTGKISRDGTNDLLLETILSYMKLTADNHPFYGKWMTANSKTTLKILANTQILLEINDNLGYWKTDTDIILTPADILDIGSSLSNGKDYYIYLVYNDSSEDYNFVCSLNNVNPNGVSLSLCRKIGGFHTLCADVGTIENHTLSDYVSGNILPASVWCLTHRPHCSPEGMVYIEPLNFWCDIYLQSGTGYDTKSCYGGNIVVSRIYAMHVDDYLAVGKCLLNDAQFQIASDGSNQQTNIKGSAFVSTTGGNVDTNNRRMISNYGCEDMCGLVWQWLIDQTSLRDYYSGSLGWHTQGDSSKGDFYADCFLTRAGGCWNNGSPCGSWCRSGYAWRATVLSNSGGRGRASAL